MTRPSSMASPADPVFACLSAAARHDDDRSAFAWVSTVDGAALVTASRSHGVDHVLLDWMKIVAPEHPAVSILKRRNDEAARFHLRAAVALRDAGSALREAGVQHVAFKGPILAALARSTSCRAYSDLDLMVSPHELELALEVLGRTGAALAPYTGWRNLLETEHAQVPMMLPLAVPLDLHWDLCSRPHMRLSWTVEGAEALIARSVLMDTAAGPATVLEWNDMLLHTAAHAGWSGGDRLGWLVDVDSVVRSGSFDWDTVVKRARAWGLEPLVGDVFRRARDLLGTPIPSETTHVLRGGAVGSLLRSAERLRPMKTKRSDHSPGRILSLDTRSGLVGTLGALTRRSLGYTVRRARGVPKDRVVEPRRPDDENWRRPYLSFATTGSAPRAGSRAEVSSIGKN